MPRPPAAVDRRRTYRPSHRPAPRSPADCAAARKTVCLPDPRVLCSKSVTTIRCAASRSGSTSATKAGGVLPPEAPTAAASGASRYNGAVSCKAIRKAASSHSECRQAWTRSRSRCKGGGSLTCRMAAINWLLCSHASLCKRNRIDALFGKYGYTEPMRSPARSATRAVAKGRLPRGP